MNQWFYIIIFSFTINLYGQIKLPNVFSNNMIIQADMPVRIWGWGKPNEMVSIKIMDIAVTVKADENGKWQIKLPAVKSGLTFDIIVSSDEDKIVIKNAIAGDIWLCAGQSNMVFSLAATKDAGDYIPKANYPDIRLFSVERCYSTTKVQDVNGTWTICSPQTAGKFSAVAFHFARNIYSQTKRPIGIITCAWGGTPIQVWMSDESLTQFPAVYQRWEQYKHDKPKMQKQYDSDMAKWREQCKYAKDHNKPLLPEPRKPFETRPEQQPSCLYNAMISPLSPLTFRGILWYQGESNTYNPQQYRDLFTEMTKNWRQLFDCGNLPFYYVQLPNYGKISFEPHDSAWARLRDSQFAALSLPDTAMAVTIDVGDPNDIHPQNKSEVGRRLSLIALNKIYNKNMPCSGPVYKGHYIENDKIRVFFDHIENGLIAKTTLDRQFSIAGNDKKFVWARAVIDRNSVLVYSPQINHPKAVRYLWADSPLGCGLYNSAGLPAAPFKTDDWQADFEPAKL